MLCPTQTGLNSNPTAHAHASGCAVGLDLVGLVDMPLPAFVEPEPECSNEGLLYKGKFL